MKLYFLAILVAFSWVFNASYAFNESNALLEYEKNTISIYKNTVSAVVNISNIKVTRSFWDMEARKIPQGTGSGFIWDDQGHIVTNFHVINSAEEFKVSFHNDPKQYSAKFIGGDPQKDIAVIKLKKLPKKLTPIKPGSSSHLLVGQKAIAIGNPFGLDHTITTGIISALGRKITGFGGTDIHGMIQTDSSINPGNSGGPLLNSQGELIGMNTMIYSNSGTSAGVGFAVPADIINSIVPQLIKYGKVRRPGIGISLLDDYYKYRMGIKKGIVVRSVFKGSPADKAGIEGLKEGRRGYKVGDVIIKVNGVEVNDFNDIYTQLEKFKIGDKVKITYLRDNDKEKTVKVRLYEVDP